ncbi:MAG: hypothetical protein P8Y79_06090 [Ignavibacteriaceae bacterium]
MFEELFKAFNLTSAEEQLISFSKTPSTEDISQAKVVAELYNIKKTERFVSELIRSNENLSKSNNRYALSLNLLTGALVLVGVIQILINVF